MISHENVNLDSKNHYHIVVMEPKTLDFSAVANLQQIAFAEIINKTGMGYLFTEPYYRWKYFAPAGEAKIALLYDEAGLAAVNAMYPMDILANGTRIRGWQSCDTATHPRGRGKGHFMQCIGALKNEIGSEDVFFGYPNHNSRAGLVKFGWTHHSNVRTWACVLPGIKKARTNYIEPLTEFTTEQDIFSAELAASCKGAILDRSAAYMNWRYNQHPLHQYESFAWRESGRLLGVIVLRKATISGRELAIVMETLALSTRVERGLLAFAADWGRQRKASYTLALNNTIQTMTGILSAYLPVPMWVLPKRQILMGAAASGERANTVWNMPWHIQIGDWDGF